MACVYVCVLVGACSGVHGSPVLHQPGLHIRVGLNFVVAEWWAIQLNKHQGRHCDQVQTASQGAHYDVH